jgi:hypothetical protein
MRISGSETPETVVLLRDCEAICSAGYNAMEAKHKAGRWCDPKLLVGHVLLSVENSEGRSQR